MYLFKFIINLIDKVYVFIFLKYLYNEVSIIKCVELKDFLVVSCLYWWC